MTLSSDAAMLLVTTLDSTVRSIDMDTGGLFCAYSGHKNTSYRSKAAFGPGEATVVMGDEDGLVWVWEIESVRARLEYDALRHVLADG